MAQLIFLNSQPDLGSVQFGLHLTVQVRFLLLSLQTPWSSFLLNTKFILLSEALHFIFFHLEHAYATRPGASSAFHSPSPMSLPFSARCAAAGLFHHLLSALPTASSHCTCTFLACFYVIVFRSSSLRAGTSGRKISI